MVNIKITEKQAELLKTIVEQEASVAQDAGANEYRDDVFALLAQIDASINFGDEEPRASDRFFG